MSLERAVAGLPLGLPLKTSPRASPEDFRRTSTANPARGTEPAGQRPDSALPSGSTSTKRREEREVPTVVGEEEALGRSAVRGPREA